MTRRSPAPPKETGQWDLFGDRGLDQIATTPREHEFDPKDLDDQEIIDQTPKANLSNIHALCDQIVTRDLADAAVPALEILWMRFKGFGLTSPLPEQCLTLKTLANIGTPMARSVIRKIIAAPDLPDSLLWHALQAATDAKLNPPLRQITPWLEHDMPMVRALAFTLAQGANTPAHVLETGISDPDPSVRRAALITLGNLGHEIAKSGLIAELNKNPTGRIILALIAVADEGIITRLGRCAQENQSLQGLIANELATIDNPRANKIAQRIRDQMQQR